MKKVKLSKTVKQYLKIIIALIAIFYIFYLMTKFGGFLFLCYGLIFGTIFASISEYLSEYRKEMYFQELEEKYNELIDKENDNNV